ncbi:probable acyl-activating enzyme 16, chloroplastic isoform X2 [Typha angustifolia]|uniref:probable acyl-activating enzyme 16, chloroplastic isoform X2 n=1 Tax=Typha angustifolia TaxID=59011 RepID=UPI003C308F9F
MMIQMAICFHSKPVLGGFDRPRAFMVRGTGISREGRDCIWWRRGARRARVFCSLELQHPVRRRYSPFLDNALLPGANKLVSDDCGAVPDIWKSSAEKYGDRVALVDPYHKPPSKLSYKQLEQEILNFSEGLRVVGVIPDEKLSLFADNSCRWLVADQGIMATGAINVVRGTRSADEELLQIYTHSESVALVLDSPEFFNRLAESFILSVDIRFVVLLWGEKSCLNSKAVKDIPLYDYSDIIELGRESRNALLQSLKEGQQYVFETINPDDVATLMYTSGTSDTPKGVMLTHRNLLHQIKNLWDIVPAKAGDRFLSMLPTWHAYERASEYFIFTYGVEQVYTNIKYLKAGISGGGSLPLYVDRFFEAIDVKLQNGYGLTETSPVVAARQPACNVLGTVGHPLKYTEIKVVDVETGAVLPDGSKGIVKIKGPQVMKGYYKNPSATSGAMDEDGWFNTGDIGWIAPKHAIGRSRQCGGMLVLEGRAKDTIVLSTGENVEPAELEAAVTRSSLIHQIVVVGQDQRRLGALVVPNKDEILAAAEKLSILDESMEVSKDKVLNLLYNDIRAWTAGCSFQIGPIVLVDEPFTIDNGLMTPTMKIRREKVADKYREQIADLYK